MVQQTETYPEKYYLKFQTQNWFRFHSDLDQMVKKLIDKKATIDAIDDKGETPLFEAAREGSFETVKILVEHGADFNLMNNAKKTSLDLANENGDL